MGGAHPNPPARPVMTGGDATSPVASPAAHSSPKPAHVLVVDDEPAARRSLARALMARGFVVDTAESGAAALDLVRTRAVDAVLLDREMPELDGLAVLAQLRRHHPAVEVVLMVSLADHEAAAAALQGGAYAVVTRPLPNPEAAIPPVERATERRRLLERTRTLEKQLAEHEQLGEIVGSSPRMVELLRRAAAASASSAPVLVLGERGTGKDLVARAVHRRSNRARAPLLVLSPAELGEDAAVAELAAALEQAEGGTLLLDDLGALPRAAQADLARAMAATSRVRVRVIATALPGLREQVARGEFREDLFYRLAAVLLEVPPLRRRREDIPLLAYHFLSRSAAREGKTIRRIAVEALRALRDHPWPGNVGELRGAVDHAVVMARGDAILPADLPLDPPDEGEGDADAPDLLAGAEVLELPYAEAKDQAVTAFDRAYVERRMKQTSGNVSEAARLAGMDRSNFRRLLKKARGRDEEGP
jgi:DNA-binding NtrC family response regulator